MVYSDYTQKQFNDSIKNPNTNTLIIWEDGKKKLLDLTNKELLIYLVKEKGLIWQAEDQRRQMKLV